MRSPFASLAAAGVLVLAVGAPTGAHAGPALDELRHEVNRVFDTLRSPDFAKVTPAERRIAIRRIADDIFDWNETARLALGRHWQERTPAEREEFSRLFADLLERAYLSKIDHYDGESVTYVGDTEEGDHATIRTTVRLRPGKEISVDYRMLQTAPDQWRVYDVDVWGVSLIANYRTQFNNVIRRSSWEELVRVMRAKSAELRQDEAMASPATASH